MLLVTICYLQYNDLYQTNTTTFLTWNNIISIWKHFFMRKSFPDLLLLFCGVLLYTFVDSEIVIAITSHDKNSDCHSQTRCAAHFVLFSLTHSPCYSSPGQLFPHHFPSSLPPPFLLITLETRGATNWATYGTSFTYWRPAPEVSPDEGFRREAETSINSMFPGCFRVI